MQIEEYPKSKSVTQLGCIQCNFLPPVSIFFRFTVTSKSCFLYLFRVYDCYLLKGFSGTSHSANIRTITAKCIYLFLHLPSRFIICQYLAILVFIFFLKIKSYRIEALFLSYFKPYSLLSSKDYFKNGKESLFSCFCIPAVHRYLSVKCI